MYFGNLKQKLGVNDTNFEIQAKIFLKLKNKVDFIIPSA